MFIMTRLVAWLVPLNPTQTFILDDLGQCDSHYLVLPFEQEDDIPLMRIDVLCCPFVQIDLVDTWRDLNLVPFQIIEVTEVLYQRIIQSE